MEVTKRNLRIDGRDILVEEKDINQADLSFYKDNPRIKNLVETKLGTDPSQVEIEKLMKDQEHVKKLKMSIIANDGLVEPVYVKDNVVLEGNSRLAAYRILSASNPVQWGKIRAIILPSEVTEDQVFSMLGTLHIVGKTPWSPFEQAGYLYRRVQQSRRSIEGIANELGISATEAKRYVNVYKLMLENDDAESTRWSYYFEMVKNPAIQKANENYPQHEIVPILIDMIKDGKFADARELRKVGTIANATGENAEEALEQFLVGDISLDDAVELVSAQSKLASLQTKADKILEMLRRDVDAYRDNLTNGSLKFKLRNIQQQLKLIFGE